MTAKGDLARRFFGTCDRKKIYRRLLDAMIVAGRIADEVKPYKCDFCGHWHVGKPNAKDDPNGGAERISDGEA